MQQFQCIKCTMCFYYTSCALYIYRKCFRWYQWGKNRNWPDLKMLSELTKLSANLKPFLHGSEPHQLRLTSDFNAIKKRFISTASQAKWHCSSVFVGFDFNGHQREPHTHSCSFTDKHFYQTTTSHLEAMKFLLSGTSAFKIYLKTKTKKKKPTSNLKKKLCRSGNLRCFYHLTSANWIELISLYL